MLFKHLSRFFLGLVASAFLSSAAFAATTIKIAVANYGPHPTLQETVQGLKDGLTQAGYKEDVNVVYDITDVNFDPTLIPQMISKLKAGKPDVMVALATPVAQAAKYSVKNIPLVFAAITDPVQAGLIKNTKQGEDNITGASDKQDLNAFLTFAKKILPNAKTVGMLYATGEDNDHALLQMMQAAAKAQNMKLVAFPVDSPRDIPLRSRQFKDKVDFIYVGTSGPILPSLPAIVATADSLNIPVFSADSKDVINNQVLGSFAVSYHQVGLNAASIVVRILKGEAPSSIAPIYPNINDHKALVSKKKAAQMGIVLPTGLPNVTVVE